MSKYGELFNAWEAYVNHVAPRYIARSDAPSTLAGITQAYDALRGALVVWDGGSEQTIFSTPTSNYAFRAWHDCHHIQDQYTFDLKGEIATCESQIAQMYREVSDLPLRRLFTRILEIEVIAQAEHSIKTGAFIVDQRAYMEGRLSCKRWR